MKTRYVELSEGRYIHAKDMLIKLYEYRLRCEGESQKIETIDAVIAFVKAADEAP